MCIQRLESLLQAEHVPYEMLTGEPTPTSTPATTGTTGTTTTGATIMGTTTGTTTGAPPKARISARDMAKIMIVALDGRLAMVVLPATDVLDIDRLKAASGAHDVRISSDDDYKATFPDCEAGAMPPFGNLYDVPVYAAETLHEDQRIVFAAGTYKRLMRLAYRDFARLVQPIIAPLTEPDAEP